MRKLVALASALTLVVALSALPAQAQTVVDRTAISLTYTPLGPGASAFTGAVSYAFGPSWDLLVSYTSVSGGATTFAGGGRYHLRAPSREFDPFVSLQFSSPSAGTSTILVGAGLIQTLAPGLKGYSTLNYDTNLQVIVWDVGAQYQLSRQLSLVGGVNTGVGYLGVAFLLGR